MLPDQLVLSHQLGSQLQRVLRHTENNWKHATCQELPPSRCTQACGCRSGTSCSKRMSPNSWVWMEPRYDALKARNFTLQDQWSGWSSVQCFSPHCRHLSHSGHPPRSRQICTSGKRKAWYSFPCWPWFLPGRLPQILEPSFRCRLLKPFLIWNHEEDSQRVFKWHLWQGTMCYRPSFWLRIEIVGPRMTIYFAAWIQYVDCCTNKIAMVGKKVKIRVDPEVEIRLQW